MTDNEIIKLVLEGNKDEYRLLVQKYQKMVFRTSVGFVHNKEDADDLTQEVFIRAFQSLSGFKGDSAFSTWLYRITVNSALNKVRRESRNFILQSLDSLFGAEKKIEAPLFQSETEDPEKILIRREHVEWVRRAIDSLPENQRTAIVLSRFDDLSQKQIAEIMNTTEGAVEALLQRAKKKLREKLTGHK
jgi:RNA polymerase sigma-70 factor (ECF subfamily)